MNILTRLRAAVVLAMCIVFGALIGSAMAAWVSVEFDSGNTIPIYIGAVIVLALVIFMGMGD